jgi:hypothetical protein
MRPGVDVRNISLDRLLRDWCWLCSEQYQLVDINDFGDLFLRLPSGKVGMLDLQEGRLVDIAPSVEEFDAARQLNSNHRDCYFDDVSQQLQDRGLRLEEGKIFGYKTPLCFKESAERSDNIYVADIYEYVSFMGTVHKQINDLPEGAKVRLVVEKSK